MSQPMNQESTSTTTKISRVDQVGSLLRPQALKDAYARHGNGKISDDELAQVQDETVKELIAKQESHGLSILTDGEYRRLNFQDSFVESVAGFIPKKQTIQFQESRTVGGEALQRWVPDSGKTDPALQYWRPIAERLRLAGNVPLKEWQLASALTTKPVKVTLIATDRICENFQRQNAAGGYASAEEYRADVIAIEETRDRQAISRRRLPPYIQHDAPAYTAYVDAKSLERMRGLGIDPMQQMTQSIEADNAVIDGISDVTFGIHLCRGNVRSCWWPATASPPSTWSWTTPSPARARC